MHRIGRNNSPSPTSQQLESWGVWDDSNGLLFTGDHVLPNIYPGIGLGAPSASNPLTDYLASLDAIEPFESDRVLPGHGEPFAGLGARMTAIRGHHSRRASEVVAALANHPEATVWQVAGELRWSVGWSRLHGFALLAALLQTAMHVERQRFGG
jgi:glyoxylase-like metal-dependent hydrolase (beta-lactamase superfamily II)